MTPRTGGMKLTARDGEVQQAEGEHERVEDREDEEDVDHEQVVRQPVCRARVNARLLAAHQACTNSSSSTCEGGCQRSASAG
jgi:hypothetical protein